MESKEVSEHHTCPVEFEAAISAQDGEERWIDGFDMMGALPLGLLDPEFAADPLVVVVAVDVAGVDGVDTCNAGSTLDDA